MALNSWYKQTTSPPFMLPGCACFQAVYDQESIMSCIGFFVFLVFLYCLLISKKEIDMF